MARKQPIPQDVFRQLDRLSFVSRRSAQAGAGGEHVSRRRAPSTDFVDYRAYVPGDDFRRIDWNVYGRLGALHVKVTEARERLDVILILDCSSSMDAGTPDKFEFATQLVAALAYVGASRADAVRIACLGPALPDGWRVGPFSRRARVPELVQQLSALAPAGRVDLEAGLAACVPRDVSGASLAVVVSDLLARDGVAGGLDALRARIADVAVVHVVSPEELEPNVSGEVELIDAESGATLELGVSQETLAAYRRRVGEWLEGREADCRRRGLRYVRVRTDRPVKAVVLDDLRRGGLVR
ncbi:MAG: DUF58 domain-containing protein [Chloroflexi bacterium]|nr:DUF58 domain-containing protein [Chloroflexota bacterium]